MRTRVMTTSISNVWTVTVEKREIRRHIEADTTSRCARLARRLTGQIRRVCWWEDFLWTIISFSTHPVNLNGCRKYQSEWSNKRGWVELLDQGVGRSLPDGRPRRVCPLMSKLREALTAEGLGSPSMRVIQRNRLCKAIIGRVVLRSGVLVPNVCCVG